MEYFTFEVNTPSSGLSDITNKFLEVFVPGESDERNIIKEPITGYGLCLKIIGKLNGRNHEVSFFDYPENNDLDKDIADSIEMEEMYMNYKNAIGDLTITSGTETYQYYNCLIDTVSVERDAELQTLLTIKMSLIEMGN